MKEFKIIADRKANNKEAFECWARNKNSLLFKGAWEKIETCPTHLEAEDYIKGQDGFYIGTYLADGTRVAVNDEMRKEKVRSDIESTAVKNKPFNWKPDSVVSYTPGQHRK